VAVVYAVMIEGGLGATPMGKTLLAACFITDFGTVLALGVLFADYFIKAGLFVSPPALSTAAGVIAVLLLLKMITKFIGLWPLSRVFWMRSGEATYTALLMSTGLSFGTISALFRLQNKIIGQEQYLVLVTVVILSAFVPTLIAQKFFQPTIRTMMAWGRLYQRKVSGKSSGSVQPNQHRINVELRS